MSTLPRAISTALDKVAQNAIGKDWALYAALLNHWPEIVGADYAEVTTPVKISFPKGKPSDQKWTQGQRTDGVLHIRLPKGLMLEFSYRTAQILERTTRFFGYCAIERVVFEPFYPQTASNHSKTAPKPLSAAARIGLKNDVKDIDDNELRSVLESLGETILSHSSRQN